MSSRPSIDPVIGALRQTANEVQLGRVLGAVCRDPAVARALCETVLVHAVGGGRRLTLPPGQVRCRDEKVLETRETRQRLRKRALAAGRVDLDFSGRDGWRLVIELKIDSGFGLEQREKYMAREIPVVAIVRNPKTVPQTGDVTHWVGAASWGSLREDLRRLPIAEPTRSHWLALLDVIDADGDFEQDPKVQPEAEAAAKLMRDVAPEAVAHLRSELRRLYGKRADVAVDRLKHGTVRTLRGGSAAFGIRTPGDGDWLSVTLRDVWSRTPHLWVWLFPLPDRKARRMLREPLRTIEALGFGKQREDAYLLDEDLDPDAGTVDRAVCDLITTKISELVDHHVFDAEIEAQDRRRA